MGKWGGGKEGGHNHRDLECFIDVGGRHLTCECHGPATAIRACDRPACDFILPKFKWDIQVCSYGTR